MNPVVTIIVVVFVVFAAVRAWRSSKKAYAKGKPLILRVLLNHEHEVETQPCNGVTVWNEAGHRLPFEEVAEWLENLNKEGLVEQVPIDEPLGLRHRLRMPPYWRLTESGRRAAETTPHLS